MTKNAWGRRRVWMLAVVLATMFVGFAANAGRLLVVDAPQQSDVILVLAGETDRRPARALQLLERGYGRRVVIDVPEAARIYDFTQVHLRALGFEDRASHLLPQLSFSFYRCA